MTRSRCLALTYLLTQKQRNLLMMLSSRLLEVEKRIQAACARSGRPRTDIQLLLASKKVTSDRLRELTMTPAPLLGENTVQEMLAKQNELQDLHFRWHFIGHLQSNKVKDLVGRCELIHGVDRISLATEISKRSFQKKVTSRVLIEVNTSGESSKSGVAPEKTRELIQQIARLSHIQVDGLMTIAENTDQESRVRRNFATLRQLRNDLQNENGPQVDLKELSMGMSQDFEWAIEEGATLIRLGSVVFGERQ